MNYRFLFAGAIAFAATGAHAVFSVTLDQPTQTIVLPDASTEIIFMGSATKDEHGTGSGVRFTHAGLPNDTDYLGMIIGPSQLTDWFSTPSSPTYHGPIFSVIVLPTNQVGLHDFALANPDQKAFFQLYYTGVTGAFYQSAEMKYAVDIQPVPEPATLSALALGGLAFLRRKRSRA